MLINVLKDSGYPSHLAAKLEAMLLSYAGARSSRGILQGIFPSDLFGNFYMNPIDRALEELDLQSSRYVDDIYIFVSSVMQAERMLRELIPTLRDYGLALNEAKSAIIPAASLLAEEPDLEKLFEDAVNEIAEQVDDEDFNVDYGFQSEWGDEPEDEEKGEDAEDGSADNLLELKATKLLFSSINQYPGQEENIERFCLPLFTKAKSDYAVEHVVDAFRRRPSMSQIYLSYLAIFYGQKPIYEYVSERLQDENLMDWQRMWIVASLLQATLPYDDGVVKTCFKILKDANRHDALRAVAAIYVGRFGDHSRRVNLVSLYPTLTPYVQAAIYYSTRTWPPVEKANAKLSWAGHGSLNALIASAMSK